jgi:hypothetical protein
MSYTAITSIQEETIAIFLNACRLSSLKPFQEAIYMNRKGTSKGIITTMLVVMAVLAIGFALSGCQPDQPLTQNNNDNNTLFNQTINNQIENLSQLPAGFVEFYVNYTVRNDSKYEIAKDDVFTMSKGNFTSDDISFLGVKLGDSYESVLSNLGQPDVIYIAADKSYKNLEYRRKIGINSNTSGITYHVENGTVTIVSIRPSFNKYLHGNTSFGVKRDFFYAVLGEPDYTDFALDVYKVFHYVEKGMDVYLRADRSAIFSFYEPKEFKGVEYITVQKELSPGVVVNVTEAVLKK